MSKNSYYFPHDYNAHNDPKIVKLAMNGWDLVGLYWSIIGMLHEQDGWLSYDCETIAFALRADKQRINTLINFPELFLIENNKFTTQRVLVNLELMHSKREKAQISALKRWNDAKAMRTHSEGNAKKGKKGKKEKNINAYEESEEPINAISDSIDLNATKQEIISHKRKRKYSSMPPTVEEIEAYAKEKGYVEFNSQNYFDYNQSRGWILRGGQKMIDWKADVRFTHNFKAVKGFSPAQKTLDLR